MQTLGERIKLARGAENQDIFATALDISRGTLSLYERNEGQPSADVLLKICTYRAISPTWLLAGTGPIHAEVGQEVPPQRRSTDTQRVADARRPETVSCSDTEIVLIPMVEAVLSAGHGSFEVSDYSERKYAFRADFLRRKGNAAEMVLMRVDGDSMEPEIKAGDVVLIDQSQKSLRPGMLYAVGVEDMVFLKVVSAQPGKVILRSYNDAYPPLEVDTREHLEDSVRIVGRCVWSCREL